MIAKRCLPLVAILFASALGGPLAEAAPRPNVLLFLVDDLGGKDLACFGSKFHRTPRIDALATSGIKFSNAYAASSVCSPTRAALLTGRHPVRVGITDWIPGMLLPQRPTVFGFVEDHNELPHQEITLAERLRDDGGYATYFLGKWHLGSDGFLPTDQGFDLNIGGCDKGSPPGGYYAPWTNPALQAKQDGEYLTQRLTDEAVALIERDHSEHPFFLMMSYYNVHTPIEPDNRTIHQERARAKEMFDGPTGSLEENRDGTLGADWKAVSRGRQDNPEYASMVGAVDRSVGEILDALSRKGLDENTIIVFTSDNGGLCTVPQSKKRVGPTSNLPLRSGKGWLYEGGIRVPLIIRAPGATTPNQETEQVAVSQDLLPTILSLVNVPSTTEITIDGIDLSPTLKENRIQDRQVVWHYPHYHGSGWTPGTAIRDGQWKLIHFAEQGQFELYNLSTDVGEQRECAAEYPAITKRLKQALRDELQRLGAADLPSRGQGNGHAG